MNQLVGQRIAIVGSAGAGKSTLARQLGQLTGLPVIHLDQIFWKPGWESMPGESWLAVNEKIIQDDRWIIDGNYGNTMATRLQRADSVIFLDRSRWVCLWRVFKRFWTGRFRKRLDMPDGCEELLDMEFIEWIWHFPNWSRPVVQARLNALDGTTRIIIIKTEDDLTSLLKQIDQIKV